MTSYLGFGSLTQTFNKLKEKENRKLVYVYFITCLSFVITIKLIYLSFEQFLLIRDDQDQQNTYMSNKNNNESEQYVIIKIIYEDPILMAMIFQVSFIILYPLLQVYYFVKYYLTPKQQLLNVLRLHRDHDEINVDSDKALTYGEGRNRHSLDSKNAYRPSLESNRGDLNAIHSIVEEEEEPETNQAVFDPNDLQPFPQSDQNSFQNLQKMNKIPDYKRKLNSDQKGFASGSLTQDCIKIFYSLKPVESLFFALGIDFVVFSVFRGIAVIPFLDTIIMFNLSTFEILSLLLSCLNFSYFRFEDIYRIKVLHKPNRKNFFQLLKSFSGMCVCIFGCFLATSERKGTEIASTATTNADPFIFNRLGGCLILGLFTLLIGPLVIAWNTAVMQYLYVLIHSNNSKSMKSGFKNLYRILSNQALYTAFRGRQNTLSLEMDLMHNNSNNRIDSHSEEQEHEQDYTEKELAIQYQSLLTFQVSFISTIAFLILLFVKLLFPENSNKLAELADDNIIADASNVVVETCALDSKLLTNLLFIFPTFLFGLLYLSRRVKVGILISLPMSIIFMSFLIELVWPTGSKGSTLLPGDSFESGEVLGYVLTGLGAMWGIITYL